eukprot:146141_1
MHTKSVQLPNTSYNKQLLNHLEDPNIPLPLPTYDKDKGYSIGKAQTKGTKKTKSKGSKNKPPFRKYKYALSRTKCCEKHNIKTEHIMGGLKAMKQYINAAEKTSEPWEDRKTIYGKVAAYLRIDCGYVFYGPGHPLPGIFREKLREAIPG